ncbi:MAG: hypothetical protein SFU56_14660 [Capsulimonadales bacterium]|nr:hypothetical protein [Capsulimonadales bacterium]
MPDYRSTTVLARQSRRPVTRFVAGIGLALILASGASADLKLTSRVTGAASGGKPTTSVVYYKGKKMRSETGNTVVLFDGEKGTVTSLNMTAKTYNVVPIAALSDNAMLRMVEMKTAVTLKPGGKTKKILGKQTKNYVFTATIKMSLKKEMLDRMKAQGSTASPPTLPTIVLTGENWVAEQVAVSSGAMAASMSPMSAVPGLKALMDKFKTIKGIPLESRINIAMQGGPQEGRRQSLATEATSISEEGLADTLFVVPAGFTRATAPTGRPGGAPGPGN